MRNQEWIWTLRRSIPSRTESGAELLEELLSELERHEWLQSEMFGVNLALEEAVVNAIKHGNQEDPQKQVHLVCMVSHEAFRVEITDEGEGFAPEDVPDPLDDDNLERAGGRGIMLMRNFMSRVNFNEQGNCVVMEKWANPSSLNREN